MGLPTKWSWCSVWSVRQSNCCFYHVPILYLQQLFCSFIIQCTWRLHYSTCRTCWKTTSEIQLTTYLRASLSSCKYVAYFRRGCVWIRDAVAGRASVLDIGQHEDRSNESFYWTQQAGGSSSVSLLSFHCLFSESKTERDTDREQEHSKKFETTYNHMDTHS